MRYLTTNTSNMMDHLFDSMCCNTPTTKAHWNAFSTDITEEGEEYGVRAELPGFTESEVAVTLNENLLVISAQKAPEGKDEGDVEAKYLLRERRDGEYKRSFVLPKNADRDSIRASLKDGILSLLIAKKPEAKPLSIKIN